MVCSKNYVIDKIIRYSSNNFSQYVKELFSNGQLTIGNWQKETADVKIMNLQTWSHIKYFKNYQLPIADCILSIVVEDIGVEPMTLSLQS